MTFQEWFNSEPHRAKYSNDHPAYLAAQEAWKAAHEACAKVCDAEGSDIYNDADYNEAARVCAAAIRARSKQ